MAHTPGPWHPGHFVDDSHTCDCRGILSEYYAGAIAEIIVGNGRPISDGGNDAPPLEEARANARLIAAAPELLAALEAVLNPDNAPFIATCDSAVIKIMDDARAAVAKATT